MKTRYFVWAVGLLSVGLAGGIAAGKEYTDSVPPGTELTPGDWIYTKDKKYGVTLEGDGDFVFYSFIGGKKALFSSKGHWPKEHKDRTVKKIVFQGDGNVVAYDENNKDVWATYTEKPDRRGTGFGIRDLGPILPFKIRPGGGFHVVVWKQDGEIIWWAPTD